MAKYRIGAAWPVNGGAWMVDAGTIVEETNVQGELKAVTGNFAGAIIRSNGLPLGATLIEEKQT